jgi:hypothetical protein
VSRRLKKEKSEIEPWNLGRLGRSLIPILTELSLHQTWWLFTVVIRFSCFFQHVLFYLLSNSFLLFFRRCTMKMVVIWNLYSEGE